MSHHAPDNITGPDPWEDDPTPRERTLDITVTIKVDACFSNRDAEKEETAILNRIEKVLADGGYAGSEAMMTESIPTPKQQQPWN